MSQRLGICCACEMIEYPPSFILIFGQELVAEELAACVKITTATVRAEIKAK